MFYSNNTQNKKSKVLSFFFSMKFKFNFFHTYNLFILSCSFFNLSLIIRQFYLNRKSTKNSLLSEV